MTDIESLQGDAFSLLYLSTPRETAVAPDEPAPPPNHSKAALKFFSNLLPYLTTPGWEQWEHDGTLRGRLLDVKDLEFAGSIDWKLEGPPELLSEEPPADEIMEAFFAANSLRGRYCLIKVNRNTLPSAVVGPEETGGYSTSRFVNDLVSVDVLLAADTPKGYREVVFEAVSGSVFGVSNPPSERHGHTTSREKLTPKDIEALCESVALARGALACVSSYIAGR